MNRPARAAAAAIGMAIAAMAQAPAGKPSVDGRVTMDGVSSGPIPYAFIGLLSSTFDMVGQTTTGLSGTFHIDLDQPLATGFLMVQPPLRENADGIGVYTAQPRIFQYAGEAALELRLPAAGSLVLKAYDAKGALMRWQDFRNKGIFGGQFMYLAGLDDAAVPAVAWPVFDQSAKDQGQPRELGLPALVAEPGAGYVPQVLFWDVPGYGRLQLRADNDGQGFSVDEAGDSRVLELNVELARTALHDLARSLAQRPSMDGLEALRNRFNAAVAEKDPVARATAADTVLAGALRLNDQVEVAKARAAIPTVRKGTVRIAVRDADGNPLPNCAVKVHQQTSDFLFGVFEGSPYNAKAFALAREAGFNLATVLLGWGWTDARDGKVDAKSIDQTFGISALRDLGFTVKAHGVVWLQEYGILPERARGMTGDEVHDALLAQEKALLDALHDRVGIWEAMNEPNVTNVLDLPRALVTSLLRQSAKQVVAVPGVTSLVNGAHEGDYGRRFALYALDGRPLDDWNRTYSAYLAEVNKQGGLDDIHVIGLQYYPGFHFNESFGGLQGPATTPAWFAGLIDRYAAFGRPVHITECSMPSSFQAGWTCGYWREPWNETTQADYAEMVYTIAFGHPSVRSISWWDITDQKPSVTTGGLVDAMGRPKPVFERLKGLLQEWTHDSAEGTTDAHGVVELTAFAGEYGVEIHLPDGTLVADTVHIRERETVAFDWPGGARP